MKRIEQMNGFNRQSCFPCKTKRSLTFDGQGARNHGKRGGNNFVTDFEDVIATESGGNSRQHSVTGVKQPQIEAQPDQRFENAFCWGRVVASEVV